VLKSKNYCQPYPDVRNFLLEVELSRYGQGQKAPDEKGDSFGGTKDQAYEISESPQ